MTAARTELTEVDDGEVIRSSLADPERFAVLFDRYAKQVHQYVSRRLGTQLADDITGEAFLIAFIFVNPTVNIPLGWAIPATVQLGGKPWSALAVAR